MKKFLKNKLIFKEFALIFFAYSVVTIVVTWPFVLNFSSSVWGYVGDNWGSIWQAWWEKKAVLEGLDYRVSPLVGFPWGTNVSAGGVKEWLWWGPMKLLTFPFSELVAFNLVSFLSFPLSGLTMYGLMRWVLKSKKLLSPPAFVAGLIFTFAPYHFWQSYTHISLGQIQYLPLYFLAFLYFFERPSVERGLLWGASFAAIVYSSFYYTYFVGLVSIPLVFVYSRKLHKLLKLPRFWAGAGAFLVIAILGLVPIYLSLYKGQVVGAAGDILHRDIQDLLSLSIRPWDFLIPAPDHFLFGKYTSQIYAWIRSQSMDFKTISAYLPEKVLYVGWVGLILGCIAMIKFLKTNKYAPFFVTLAAGAFLLGLPPFIYIKTHQIFFPSYFLYKFFPMFRVYTRVGVLAQLAVGVLAGLGMSFFLSKFKSSFSRVSVAALVAFIILFEFQGKPAQNSTDVSNLEKVDPAYAWLIKRGKPGAIIEYPQEYDSQEALFFQRYHERPIFNMLGTPDQYILWKKLHNITDPEVPGMLAALGIKYAVWHHSDTLYPKGNPIDEPRYRKFYNPWLDKDTAELALVYKGPDAYIFEITVGPSFGSKEDVLEAVKSSLPQ